MTGAPFPPHLRLVPPSPPPRPGRIEVWISGADKRTPIGRTRPFRLSDSDLERLITHAERLEARHERCEFNGR